MKYLLFYTLFLSFLFASENSFTKKYLSEEEIKFLKENPIIKVSNERDWAPYDYNINGEAQGYSVDYLKMLSNKLGIKFIFITDEWSDLIQQIKDKKIDIIHPLTINESREKYLNFTNPIITNRRVLVTNDSLKNNINSLEDLEGKRLAVVKEWSLTSYLKENYPKIKFIDYLSSEEILEAVAFGEADATIDSYLTVNYLKQKFLLNNLQIVKRINLPNFSSYLHIGVRKDWLIFRNILQKTMDRLSENEIQSIKEKWAIDGKKIDKNIINFSKNEIKYLNNNPKIKMCVDPNWFPYEEIKDGKHIGISSDYFKIFQNKLNSTIELVPTSTWTQTLDYAKSRKCDIISLAVQTPSRTSYLNFTKPYLNLPLVLATKLDKPFFTGINNLLEHKFVVIKGYFHVELLRNKYPSIKLLEVDSIEKAFDKVISGEVYGFIDSLTVVGHRIQTQYIGNLKITGKLDESFSIGTAIRNDNPELLSIFNKLIEELTMDQHQEILNKWVSIKYEKSFNLKYLWNSLAIIIILLLFFAYRQYLLKKQNLELIKTQKELENSLKEIKNKDKLLFEQSKMVALGEMMGNIAHQWRQPLSVISTAASGARIQKEMNILEDEIFFEAMDGIVNNANYLSKTIDDFRNFILENKTKSAFNLTKTIDNDLTILSPMLKLNEIEVIKNMEENIIIKSIANELTQVIINIITNAKDKFIEDNKIERFIFIETFRKEDKVCISIKDNAGGIPLLIIDKIFEPYVTTKYRIQGTGLSLYMTKQIVTQSLEGTIEVSNVEYEYNNKKEKGAKFLITL